MKRLWVLLIGLFVCGTALCTLNDGLVAHYPFNGNADDVTANGHNGTVVGASLTTDRFGNANSAYQFYGSGSHIVVPDSEALRLSQTDYTLSSWSTVANPDALHNVLLAKRGPNNSDGWFHSLQTVNSGSVRPYVIISGGHLDPRVYTPVSVPTSTWVHTVVTYELASKTLSFYINGELISEHSNMPSPNPATTADLTIGKDSKSELHAFNGAIDDISIYNRALSPSEILQIYNYKPNIAFAGFYPSTTHVNFGDADKSDHLFFSGSFVLDERGDGIDPVEEAMVLKAGPLTLEIPLGSFKKSGPQYKWIGEIDGARIKGTIMQHKGESYSFSIQIHGLDLSGWSNPEEWELGIGNDIGKATKWLKGHLLNDNN